MHRFSIDYRKRDGKRHGTLLDRGHFIHDLPRLIPVCRLFGHRPVVDGTQGIGTSKPSRWVCCDRCGIRADPQGDLNPAEYGIGDRYSGPRILVRPQPPERAKMQIEEAANHGGPDAVRVSAADSGRERRLRCGGGLIVAVLTGVLACLFAFLVLAPHADVRYDYPPAAWSSR